MTKTCRTCKWASLRWRCPILHKYLLGNEVKECHEPRETPLLVDELAKAARNLTLELSTFLIEEARAVWGNTNVACLVTKRDRLNEVLARYQEEVGDG